MSGYLAGKVWQSNLEPELKPFAAALADIANDDGSSIYPTVEYVGWLIGVDRRTVQRAIDKLRDRKILVLVSAARPDGRPRGGRGHSAEYRLDEDALPARRPWKEERLARRAAEATEELPEPFPNPYDEDELADRRNSGIMPPFTEETAAPTPINSGADEIKGGADEIKGGVDAQTAAPTPPDPSSDPSSDLDPPKDPSTPVTRARAREAPRPSPGLRGADREQESDPPEAPEPPRTLDPETAFVRTLANQISPADWRTYFAGAGVELNGDRLLVSVAPKDCAMVRTAFAPKIALAARAAGIAGVEILGLAEASR